MRNAGQRVERLGANTNVYKFPGPGPRANDTARVAAPARLYACTFMTIIFALWSLLSSKYVGMTDWSSAFSAIPEK